MLNVFTTNAARHRNCYNVFTTNAKTTTNSREVKFENFLRGFMARQNYFTHLKKI